MVTVTARGRYLKDLVDERRGRISVRKLAGELAKRPELPNDTEDIRRALQRYITDGSNDRDVSTKYVNAISDVLGLDPAEWPAATSRPTVAALQRRVEELETRVDQILGDPSAPAQDGEQ